MAEILGRVGDPTLRVITCHLGNGCSITAIRGGHSVDTSMGLTPLEGLLMGTRAGDIDAGIVLHVMTVEELGISEANALLTKHSGLLGISGVSNDMRALLQAESEGHERARVAVEVFCYRLTKYIAAHVVVLEGIDAVVFTGGIGENAIPIRARSVAGLDTMGLRLDHERNAAARAIEAEVSADYSPGKIWVIPTNEELLIARDTMRIVSGLPPE